MPLYLALKQCETKISADYFKHISDLVYTQSRWYFFDFLEE